MFSLPEHFPLKYSPRTRRYLLIVFFVFVAIVLLKVGTHIFVRYVDDHWEKISEARTRDVVAGAVGAFEQVQRDTYGFAHFVAENATLKSLLNDESSDRVQLFSSVQELNAKRAYSLEVYDRHVSLVAWEGQQSGADSGDIRRAFNSGPLSTVPQSALYTFLTVLTPIRSSDGKAIGVVVVSRPVEVNYPLNNRFLTSSGLQRELSNEFGTTIRLDFGGEPEPNSGGQSVSDKLVSIDGRRVGTVYIDRPTLTSYLQGYQRVSDCVFSSLVAVVPIIIALAAWPSFRRLKPLVRVFLLVPFVWAVRYLWIGVDFPSVIFPEGIFDPSSFASPFGFGLTKSIGEVLISSLFFFTTASYCVAILVCHRSEVEWKLPRFTSLAVPILLVAIGYSLAFLTRGYAEALRSAVFDSKLKYIDPTTIVPDPLIGVMLFAMLLLTISGLLVGVIVYLLSAHLVRVSLKTARFPAASSWIPVVLLFAMGSFLFGLLYPNPQTTLPYRIILIAVIVLLSFVLQREVKVIGRPYTGKTLVLAVGLSILVLVPILDAKIHEHDRQALRLYAAELIRPVDNWMRLTLQETLGQVRSDDELVSSLVSEDRDVISGLAFKLWAESNLSKGGFNCAVGIVRGGRIESLFNLGLQRSEASGLIRNVGEFPDTRIFRVRSGKRIRGLDRYVGTAPIRAPDGRMVANAVVIIVSGQGALLRTEAPEILQTPSAMSLETEFRNVVVSEFVDGRLVQTTGENFERNRVVPEEAYNALVSGKSTSVWADETVDDKGYESLYTLQPNEIGPRRILALSMASLDLRWHVFNLLKVVFLYLIIGTVVAGIYVLFIAARNRSFRLSFRGKLLAALLSLATIPLVLLSYYDKQFTDESRAEILHRQAEDGLRILGLNLLSHLGTTSSASIVNTLSDSLCERIAQETGSDFNVYLGAFVQASSRPELFDAELMDTRLNSFAYKEIVLEGERLFIQTESIGKYPFLVAYERMDDANGRPFGVISVFTAYKHQAVDEELFKRSALVFGTYAGVMVLIILVGVFFAYRIASPIKKLTEGIRSVSRGDLNSVLEVGSKDELGELVAAFNKMTQDLKRIQKELAVAERELAWREMAKQVAHEIKNPLTPMKLSIQHLRQAYADRVKDFHILLDEVSRTIIDQVDALGRIAAEFSAYAKMPERQYEPCNVDDLLVDAIRLFDQETNVRFRSDLKGEKVAIMADREELRRVFINVLRNAVQAIVGAGEIAVTTHLSDGQIDIVIADTGRGIPDEIKGRLFEPNFSTKSEGMGLGLAISKQTITDLKGRIEIESTVGKGTQVRITLPVTPAV
jgi:two-component system nitrogen regulation sensor histidine kinase NtrY